MQARLLRLACAIALVSAAALAYQLLLMRWLAIAHWHPLAVVIISLALLGHGASGSALSVLGPRAVRGFDRWFPCAALAFALTALLALRIARAIPFDGLELAWDPRQIGWLSALYVCLSVPFFFAAACFGLAFARYGAEIPRLYGADLLGAGAGALLAMALLHVLSVAHAVAAVAILGATAALLAMSRRALAWSVAPVAMFALWAAWMPPGPVVNPYKALSKSLLVRDARVIAEREGMQGWLTVLASPRVPLRVVQGLSVGNPQEPAAQLGVFVDGDLVGVVTDRRDPRALAYLQRTTGALPYVLRPRARVLVLGAGTGGEVAQALAMGARSVQAVERDARQVALLRGPLATFSARLYDDPRVHVRISDARGALRAERAPYDIVVLPAGGSSAASGAGVQAVAENFAMTTEALRDAIARLAPGGVLAVTQWDKQPPRDLPKLFATAMGALRASGDQRPEEALAVIRNWDAWTLVARRGAFTRAEIARLRAFADEQGFDLVYHPGLRAADANRFHRLARDDAFLAAQALASPRGAAYVRAYKFDIAPARDDRPYFANFFRWATLPELWRLREQGAAVLLDSGYLLLAVALLQAVPISAALVLLPLFVLPRADAGIVRWRAAVYFVALGLAFLFIEIACLARLQLLFGQPWLAIAVGLAGFLAFAGLGSVQAPRWRAREAVFAIGLGLGWHLATYPVALAFAAAWSDAARACVALVTIAPLAFAMGLPLPIGLSRLAREAPAFVPWAWGLNGCASVVAAVGALLVAVEIGLRGTLLLALALYAVAAWTWRAERQ